MNLERLLRSQACDMGSNVEKKYKRIQSAVIISNLPQLFLINQPYFNTYNSGQRKVTHCFTPN